MHFSASVLAANALSPEMPTILLINSQKLCSALPEPLQCWGAQPPHTPGPSLPWTSLCTWKPAPESLFPVPNRTISIPSVPVTLHALGLPSSQNSSSKAPADSLGPTHPSPPRFHPVLNFEFLGAFDINDHLSLSIGFFQHPAHPTAATGLSSLCLHLSAVPALISSVCSPTHNHSHAFPIPTAPH